MHLSKIDKALICISVVGALACLARGDLFGSASLLYLIWNLFLASVPYIISRCCIKKDISMNRFTLIFIPWILFFPNAPYLVTDVIHIAIRMPALLWYDSLLFFFFGWIGILLGTLSLLHVHQYVRAHMSYWRAEFVVCAICFIASFGVYLGRFERWNSFDLFTHPIQFLENSATFSNHLITMGTPLVFMGVFTVFMYAVYKTTYVLVSEKNTNF